MRKYFFIGLFFACKLCLAQTVFPQDYFISPLDVTLIPSGSFAELRANHFHSGLDLKTQQRVGLKVYASADGFVSRIKITHFGYGKALYITHPNGYTTVYAHLQKFAPKIEAYIKQKQYEQETYEIELFLDATELVVAKREVVAYSGSTGSSNGPHLHFEIRNKAEHPINPLLFGLKVKDNTLPTLDAVYAYSLNENAQVNGYNSRQKLRLTPLKNGDYSAEKTSAYGKIGIGIEASDRHDLASNKNGLSNIQSFYNGNLTFEMDFNEFAFSESNLLNRYIDYAHYKTKKERIQKLFTTPDNCLSLYKNMDSYGVLAVEDSTANIFKTRLRDFNGNESWLTITIDGKKMDSIVPKENTKTPHYIIANSNTFLKQENVSVSIYKNTFYEDFYIKFKAQNDTLYLHEDTVPATKSFTINYDISHYTEAEKNTLYIAELVGYYQKQYYTHTIRKGDTLIAQTKYLGKYTIVSDKDQPTIEPINFQKDKWLSKYNYLKLKIEDTGSGISNYRATINGKWILMEYEPKTHTLTYNFNDGIITETKNNFKLIVTDNVGNNTTFEAIFFRK